MKRKNNPETAEEQEKTETPEKTQESDANTPEETQEQKEGADTEKQEEIPASVDAILKLYPQYEECYVDKFGFVYPKNTPKYQRKDAVLYKNKYYKP